MFFVKHFLFSKVTTYRLEASTFVITQITKSITQKNFPKFYKEPCFRNHVGKPLWWSPGYRFWNIFWQESVLNSGYSRITVCKTQTCNFIKTNSILDVFPQMFKTFTITHFHLRKYLHLWFEESNHIKDHKPVRSDFPPFCINCPWI